MLQTFSNCVVLFLLETYNVIRLIFHVNDQDLFPSKMKKIIFSVAAVTGSFRLRCFFCEIMLHCVRGGSRISGKGVHIY